MTSMEIRSSKSGSTRSSMRTTWRGHCAFPSIRCISVWKTVSSLCPCSLRRMSISQSPMESTAIIGCSLPWILVLLSRMPRQIVVEPRLSVHSKASLMRGIGPLYSPPTLPLASGRSWAMAMSSQALSSSRGSSEASMPNSSICDTPSATPRSIGEITVASASRCPGCAAFSGCVFWYAPALKQRGLFFWFTSSVKCWSRR
mmetsp:Transcript_39399/g.104146  ORF Transcript_39399/g.104146 Transcript_39399/m.104146 type:complete len:201 (+) Transcript_39399:83-685(+)